MPCLDTLSQLTHSSPSSVLNFELQFFSFDRDKSVQMGGGGTEERESEVDLPVSVEPNGGSISRS